MKSNFDEINNYRTQKLACCMTCDSFRVRLDDNGYDEEYCTMRYIEDMERQGDTVYRLNICDFYKEFELK